MKQKNLMLYQQNIQFFVWAKDNVHIILGALYVALLSQVEIPLKPIPMTMQTFAIFSLALFQGSKKSFFSLVLYLLAATIGLPVFPSASIDPLWIFAPSAGYCLSFPLAAYIVGKSTEMKNPVPAVWMMAGLCAAQLMIYVLGVSWLSSFIGWKLALQTGFYPFVLFGFVKLLAAFSAKMAARPLIQLLSTFYKKIRTGLSW